MTKHFINRDWSIAQQVSAMRSRYPQFATNFISHTSFKTMGTLQPTSRSVTYNFVLKYHLMDSPKITIVSPPLQKSSKGEKIPHLYAEGHLCLYHPKYGEFSKTDFICDTIIPWASLWLYHYEVWHLTGDWLGGGEHPTN